VQKALTAAEHARRTETAYYETVEAYDRRLINDFGTFTIYRDPVSLLDRLDGWVVEASSSHDAAVGHVHDLMAEPALRSLPTDRLQAQRDTWRHDRDAQIRAEQAASERAALGPGRPHPAQARSTSRRRASRCSPRNTATASASEPS
jgi:hypothetical protein